MLNGLAVVMTFDGKLLKAKVRVVEVEAEAKVESCRLVELGAIWKELKDVGEDVMKTGFVVSVVSVSSCEGGSKSLETSEFESASLYVNGTPGAKSG